jgi:lipopolysaccharide transport system ATP-binding protein
MSDVAIRVENLSKRYHIGRAQQRHDTLRDALAAAMRAPLQSLRRSTNHSSLLTPHDDTIWALKDVSFEVQRGEVVGIIGRNGAGKSTLLKILSRITEPTEGRAIIHGRVGSLLEVGTGFHPELTGRENIYLNGAILGMRRAEIDRKFDEIVAFAEIEKFMDTPVKHYSSGMYVRLAFAVAAHLEPEILLVDEVLAVGDAAFQKRCLGKMGDVAREGRTVLFVSHNMSAITRLCERTLWIDQGCLCMTGSTEVTVSRYLTNEASLDGQCVWERGMANPGVDEFMLRAIRIKNEAGEITSTLDARKPFWVEIEYEIIEHLPFCRVGLRLSTVEGITVFAAYDADQDEYAGPRDPGHFVSKCKIPGFLLNPGRFVLSSAAGMTGVKTLMQLENVLFFDVVDTGSVGSHITSERWGIIRPKLEWRKVAVLE